MEEVDCSKNPYDLRPAADVIVRRIKEQLSQSKDGRLMVGIGERHDNPSHLALEQLTVSRLIDEGMADTLTAAFEMPANLLGHAIYTPKLGYALSDLDASGETTLLSLMGIGNSRRSPLAFKNLCTFLYKNRIQTIFNDAGRLMANRVGMCPDDPFFKSNGIYFDVCYGDSDFGMKIRNRRMCETAYAQGGLVLQFTGIDHILEYGQSSPLQLHARRLNMPMLPVLLKDRATNLIGSDAIVIKGLHDGQFGHYSKYAAYRKDREEKMLCKIFENSGREIGYFDPMGRENKRFYKKKARKALVGLVVAAYRDNRFS